ncbi:glycosyltransferase [Georgenia thermotolerans]|uniref:D-inositol 3-phosphate glycosyltransferase n=1 Tax=Georgenia thermotolerans TaxID=527326 RepID=A0A7J5UQK8_9MICO|nr:glycosyltransferase [Georgenia thermotolerans]KAE8764404.1 glycosyltransferase [Georgenia thermotolerans]
MGTHMLVISTVSRSLVLQSPASWEIAREQGLRLTFAAARDPWSERLAHLGTFIPLPAERSLSPSALGQLSRALRRLADVEDWDLVQVQTPIVAALWRLVAPERLRRRTLYVAHGFHFQAGERRLTSALYRTVERTLAARALAVATVSREDHAWLTALPARRRPAVVWSLPGAGVDVRHFHEAPSPSQAGVPYVLFCGDLNANKDPLLAVEAVERCRAGHPGLRLVVIGEGPLRGPLEELARARPWLVLIDRTDGMRAWMAGAGALLAPSRREGVPRVIIEALATGTPVLARSNRGSRELLGGGAGTVLPAGAGAAQWAKGLDLLLREPPDPGLMLRRAMAYDLTAYRPAYADLLGAVLAAAGRGVDRVPALPHP